MGVKGNTYRKTALLDVFERVRGAGGERESEKEREEGGRERERERSNKTETSADKGLIWERG